MIATLTKVALICTLISLISATNYPCHEPPRCGKNEEYKPGDSCDKTCEIGLLAPPQDCKCMKGFVRHFGICIKSCECPTCKTTEIYKYCGPACPLSCKNKEGEKPCGKPCTENCVAGCFCKKGLIRSDTGDCIEKCPPKCGENEEYKPNGPRDKTCEKELLEAPQDCKCKTGFVRHFGKCIKSTDCPKCKANEIYRYCGSACPASCKNKEGKKPCGGPCTDNCVAGCFCCAGLVRGDAGDCIDPSKCHSCPYTKRGCLPTIRPTPCPTRPPPKPVCGKNEFYCDRAPVFPRACDNLKKVLCKSVKPGCACKPGYIRESSAKGAKCIEPCKCPPCH